MNKEEFTQRVLEAESSLYHVALAASANKSDCEDAVQEAILTAYEKLHTLREEKYFKTWLTRVLINTCFKMSRSRKNIVSFEDYMPDEAAGDDTELSEVREAVMALPPKIRTAVVLYYIEGYSVDETAYMMRLPAGTVKSRLHKGRKMLKDTLGDTDIQEKREIYEK